MITELARDVGPLARLPVSGRLHAPALRDITRNRETLRSCRLQVLRFSFPLVLGTTALLIITHDGDADHLGIGSFRNQGT